MKVEKIVTGMMPTNGYIVYDEVSKEGYIIDPDGHYNEFLFKVALFIFISPQSQFKFI